MARKIKKILIFFSLLVVVFAVAHFALALDVGLDKVAGTGLSAVNDPRIIAAKIIRIVLGFLGIIAIGLIIYAGWLWMSAGGEEEKIEKAKKILIGALIGMVICLASFAIASFIISKILEATGSGSGGGDGPACDPPCSSGQYCCSGSCSNSPCDVPPSFNIRSTVPEDLEAKVIRNVQIKVFFNKNISAQTSQIILNNNLKVEKIATIASTTGAETAINPIKLVAGTVASSSRIISFKSSAACGNEQNTQNCLDEWSKYRVTVNGFSGLVSTDGLKLDCALGAKCQFVFSTSDAIDTSGPKAGILSAQICKDDGTLTLMEDANLVDGWAKDDVGVADIKFCSQKLGGTESCFPDSIKAGGLGQTYLNSSYKYDTKGYQYQIGDNYTFRVRASDVADQTSQADFTTKIRAGHCCNGIKDASETDVDCGGECGACDGAACADDMSEPATCNNSLCSSQVCRSEGSAADKCANAGYAAGTASCCLCQRPPVITGLSPVGGFCKTEPNKDCLADSDCVSGDSCDKSTPNGAVGNFFTIYGKYFGANSGKVFVSNGSSGWIEAKLTNNIATGNALCGNNVWSDSQIIAIVPSGANTGAIKVQAASGLNTTSDKIGVPNFKINTINRPGICKLSPDSGRQDDEITYNGVKFSGVSPYFGNLDGKIAGVAPVFNDKNGTAKVPNITTGRTTSFVLKDKIYSNFLNFYKNEEPYKGPFISSFDPREGSAGQYVTINGGGFGSTKGLVYFGDLGGAEASFDFPPICADSIWSDKQVIVKVPTSLTNGNYKITMKIGTWPAIDTSSIQPAVDFKFDKALPLKPSLCKIDPIIGRVSSRVSLYGEYFGAKKSASIRFQTDKNQTGNNLGFWAIENKAFKATTTVPVGAISGAVRIIQADKACGAGGICAANENCVGGKCQRQSNPVNFTVGICQQAADCGGSGNLCCSAGTPYSGQCKTGTVEQEACFPEVNSCVYEWNFSTAGKPSDCASDQEKCNKPAGSYGAAEKSYNCCAKGSCNTYTGKCDDCLSASKPDKCGDGSCCSAGGCKGTPSTCTDPESCAGYGDQCNNSYFCPNSPGQCSTYTGGRTDKTAVIGSCDYSCNNFTNCQTGNCTYKPTLNKCAKNNSSCALPRIVNYTIGSLTATSTADCLAYEGQDRWIINVKTSCPSGWTSISGGRCAENNSTCSVCGTGFKCVKETETAANGICLVDQPVCPSGSTCSNSAEYNNKCIATESASAGCECCCRKNNNNQDCCAPLKCEGACGEETDPANTKFGFCTGCGSVGTTQAEHNSACNCSGASGKFCMINSANPTGICQDCSAISDAAVCSGQGIGTCCVDAMNNNGCRGGIAPYGAENPGSPDYNYCAYFQCQKTETTATCSGPVASSTSPTYKTDNCDDKCKPPSQFGKTCYKVATSTEGTCDASICTDFNCLNEDGSGPTAPSACGTCCCDPSATPDTCKTVNSLLTCKPNQSPCSGEKRGLCCGCGKDSECGGDDTVGCGNDTCCQARPKVIDTLPAGGNVCRNSLIQATFDTEMQVSTFSGNVIVAGDYGASQCPANTKYLTAAYKPGLFVKFIDWLSGLPLINKIFINQAQALTGNFCAVLGTVSGYVQNNKTTVLEFKTQQVLDARRDYYVIIKGDSDITDAIPSGVLSQSGIGLKPVDEITFNGVNFKGKIWSFATKPETAADKGVCLVNYVGLDPSGYLFNTVVNDPADDAGINDKIIKDSDKIFSATAYYTANQPVVPIENVYNWRWDWSIDDKSVVKFKNGEDALDNNSEQTLIAQNVKEANTVVHAINTITQDQVNMSSAVGQVKENTAEVYVFLCSNPWPEYKTDGSWEPWREPANCTVPSYGCSKTNFELYYCRDAGAAGTADDLPAILSDSAVIRGQNLKCNDGTGNCLGKSKDDACSDGSGKCEVDILKEFYFFREGLPIVAGINLATTTNSEIMKGGKAGLVWQPITVPLSEVFDKYVIYYGTSAATSSLTQSITAATNGTLANPILVSNLTNGVTYYFAVTARYKSGAESDYSNKTSAVPADTWAPLTPQELNGTAGEGKAIINWKPNADDTAIYKVYYGATSGSLGASVNLEKTKCSAGKCEITISGLTAGVKYYFAVSALDFKINESNKSGEINLIIL